MDCETEETDIPEVHVTGQGNDKGGRKIEAQSEVSTEGVNEANGLGIGMKAAV